MPIDERVLSALGSASQLPAAERSAYLDSVCGGDAAMRAEVESLLAAHDNAGRFLCEATIDVKPPDPAARPGGSAATAALTGQEHYGQIIDRYKLLEVIGEGGFGTVWMAEQREPVKRRVALKIIKLGMDTRQVIARFEAERQALAMMDHPGIARVFDAGCTASGRPYFVMEYIKGVPLLEYCDTEKLDTAARLKLFALICQAIQHAHQKGVIHRDIKPANVLVTMHDGVPVPKVIDFGIAKATGAELTQRTLFTEHRQLIGTPAYMSPEQAEMSGLDIDTRCDIYSLGVLLYELLTGTTPFPSQDLISAGYAEMMRIIREVEPQRPSTRLSTLGNAAARTAQLRMVADSRRLAFILQGDLDWIVMRCLEKDRTRRYESASSLAADVRHYLADEPVSACAPTAAYTLRKFVKRNRRLVLAAGAVTAVLMLGIAGTTAGLVYAVRESARAGQQALKATKAAEGEEKARLVAQANEQKAVAEARRAEQARLQETRARTRAETIAGFVTAALRSADAQNQGDIPGAGQEMTVLAAMEAALKDIDSGRFKDDPETEATLLHTIATVMRNNGRVTAAEPLVARAVDLSRALHAGDNADLASSIEHLAIVREQLGDLDQAESLMREALAMRRRLDAPGDTSLAGTLQAFGSLLQRKGKLEEAEASCAEALSLSRNAHTADHTEVAICLNNLALVKRARGDLAAAEPLFVESLAIHRRLYPGDHPEVAAGLNNIGIVRGELGHVKEAEAFFLQAAEMRQRLYKGDHQATASSLINLAAVRSQRGQYEQAEADALRALDMNRRLFKEDNPAVAASVACLASIQERLGRPEQAQRSYTEALAISRRLYKAGSLETAAALANLGTLSLSLSRPEEAAPLLDESLRMRQRIIKGDHQTIVQTLRGLSLAQRQLGDDAQADALLERADQMASRLAAGAPTDAQNERTNHAVRLWSERQFDKSIPMFEELLQEQRRTVGADAPRTRMTEANLAVNYKDAGRIAEAIPMLESSLRSSDQVPELRFVAPHLLEAYARSADATSPQTQSKAAALVDDIVKDFRREYRATGPELSSMLNQTTTWLIRLKMWEQAEALARETLSLRTANQPDAWSTFNSKSVLGGVLLARGRLSEAEPLLIDGYQGLKSRTSSIPPQALERLPEALERLIALAEAKGDAEAAAQWKKERAASGRAQTAP